jgi:hypothetical protein
MIARRAHSLVNPFMTGKKNWHEIAHWDRWIADPQVGALTIAITCCLRGDGLCQQAAVTWFELATSLRHLETGAGGIRGHETVRSWAQSVCERRKWEYLAESDRGLYRAGVLELSACLMALAHDTTAGIDPGRPCDLIGPLMRWVPGEVLGALLEDTDLTVPARPRFCVKRSLGEQTVPIDVRCGPETVCTVEQMRVRPHRFRVDGTMLVGFGIQEFRVAQFVQEVWPSGVVESAHCDTIDHDNSLMPFWPEAASKPEQVFSHRCSVRDVNDGLEWSDWPQVSLSATDDDVPLVWRFTTGVFRCSESDGVIEYELVGRTTWDVDWRRRIR